MTGRTSPHDLAPITASDFMHARYYSSNLGRFLSVDPVGGKVGSSQSWNRYSYVLNNPLSLVDPDGRRTKVTESIDDQGNSTISVVTEIEFYVSDGNPEDYAGQAAALVSEIEAAWSGTVSNKDGTTTTVSTTIHWAITEGGGQLPLADQIELTDDAGGLTSQIFEGTAEAFGTPAFRATASVEGGSTQGRINLFERRGGGMRPATPGVGSHEYGHQIGMVYHFSRVGMDRGSRDVMFNTLQAPSYYRIQPHHVQWLRELAGRQSGG